MSGLEWFAHIKPPTFKMAATSSAQNHELPSVLRGHTRERAMPVFEKGLPTCARAKASIFSSAILEQPSER